MEGKFNNNVAGNIAKAGKGGIKALASKKEFWFGVVATALTGGLILGGKYLYGKYINKKAKKAVENENNE